MSIRCSLLGHSYGEAEIEREREEQGSEVVVTVREFEECERCGDRKVITENKEVTALQSPTPDLESVESESSAGAASGTNTGPEASAGANTDDTPAASTTPDASTAPDANTERTASAQSDVQLGADAETAGDDAEILGDSSGSSGSPASAGSSASTDSSAAGSSKSNASSDSSGIGGSDTASPSAENDLDQAQSAADDDGVILDDDGESSADANDRTPGDWPDAEPTHPSETDGPGEWPAVGSEDDDEGFDAEPAEAGSADVEFGGSLTPESAGRVDDAETEEVEFVNAEGDALRSSDDGGSNPELSSGISAGADAPSLSGPADGPDVDAEFACPECDYRESVAGSSLRAGDICPECSRGYLAQE